MNNRKGKPVGESMSTSLRENTHWLSMSRFYNLAQRQKFPVALYLARVSTMATLEKQGRFGCYIFVGSVRWMTNLGKADLGELGSRRPTPLFLHGQGKPSILHEVGRLDLGKDLSSSFE